MPTDYLIIGVGNSLRGDDGAGWALAEQLGSALTQSGAAVQVRLVQELLPELAAEAAELAPAVLVVADCDAQATQTTQARLQRLERASAQEPLSSHGLAPGQLLTLTVRLYEFSADWWLATVPGTDFAHGEGLSSPTQAAIAAAAPAMLAQLLALPQLRA